MDKYQECLAQYDIALDDMWVKEEVARILATNEGRYDNVESYKKMLSCIDLTTLNATDNLSKIEQFTQRVNDFETEYAELDNVAAICVYPNFAGAVRMNLEVSNVNIAAVSGGFPFSQTFTEVKVAETALAVADGANEIDVVIHLGNFFDGNYEEMCDELTELKGACHGSHLKVIIESGALKSASNIKKASLLSIYAGADFIKTSTGKSEPAATLEATYVMCTAIKEYYEKTGNVIGFKAAGGIVTTQEAVQFYTLVASILGEEWMNKERFRFGASRLANNLLSDIVGSEVKFF